MHKAVGQYIILLKEQVEQSSGFEVVNPSQDRVGCGTVASQGILAQAQLKDGCQVLYLTEKAIELDSNTVAVKYDHIIAVEEPEGEPDGG